LSVVVATATLSRAEWVRAADPTYEVVDLGPTGGESAAYGVNNIGQVAGNGAGRGFLWSSQGFLTLPPVKRDDACGAVGVNAQGIVVGNSVGTVNRAVRWQHGKPKLLAKPAGTRSSLAAAINDQGQIAGYVIKKNWERWAILWTGSQAKKLRPLAGANWSQAWGINNRSQVVGNSGTGGAFHAVIWEGKQVTDLGLLPGYTKSLATDLNEIGQIVGTAEDLEEGEKAVLWQNGGVVSLPDFGGSFNRARAINESGLIVGKASGKAVLWRDGQVIDLNTLLPPNSGWEMTDAHGINDQGWIVGQGMVGAEDRAFP
jgi:uncharacterized membrane protein